MHTFLDTVSHFYTTWKSFNFHTYLCIVLHACKQPRYNQQIVNYDTNTHSHTYTEIAFFSLNWPTGPFQSLCRGVRLCMCLCVCAIFFNFSLCLITPIYKGWTSNWPIAKRFLGKSWERTLVSYLAKIAPPNFCCCCCLCHSFAWTHDGICMDKQHNLLGYITFSFKGQKIHIYIFVIPFLFRRPKFD